MTLKAFASIRFMGDELEPSFVSDILCVRPTVSYAKGEGFLVGRSGRERRGRTGLWLFNTDGLAEPGNLYAHMSYAIALLIKDKNNHLDASKALEIRNFVRQYRLDFRVSLFWHGMRCDAEPAVLPSFVHLINVLGGTVETDFEKQEEEPEPRSSQAA